VSPEADPEAAYYQAVEEYFVSRRGDPLFLSNADWNLVRKWRLAGLPLRVVLRGIKDALDAHQHGWSRERKVGSLAYCAREVEAARERWDRAVSGAGEGGGERDRALCGFAQALEEASGLGPRARAVAGALARELRERSGGSLHELTRWLAEAEGRLVEALQAEEADEARAMREAEVEAALVRWCGRMPARVVEEIRKESLVRRTLEAHALPRLSLFHLEGGGEAPS